ncbi:MAG TPA: DUF4199 domain-containing protein [Candidatus Eisenbacteria bacterium]|nr:DUF4199 domain-containing protein [Candidatus Eisenbacteria bacterium]
MGTIVKYGLILAAGVIAWMFLMGFTGWYKDPVLVNLFFLVIPFQVFLVVQALRETARQGAGYGAQIGAGVAISSIAAIFIFGASILYTTVAFPTYFSDIHAMQEQAMRRAGISEKQIAEVLEAAKRSYTPLSQAIQGFFGTVITGLVTALTAGRWIRHRPAPVAAA